MIYKFTLILYFFLSNFVLAQSPYPIKWSELEQSRGQLLTVISAKSNEFYALRWTGGRIAGSYQVSKHIDLKEVERGKIKLVANKSYANFEGVSILNGRFVVFLSDKWDGKNNFYFQYYTDDLKPDGDPVWIAGYELDFSKGKGEFNVVYSQDKNFFAVVWELEGKRSEKGLYGFKIFNNQLELQNEGEYPLPFEPELATIHAHYISNQGDYFLVMSEFKKVDNTIFKNYLNYKAVHIYHIATDGLQDFVLNLKGRRVEAVSLTSDAKQIFSITGVYGDENIEGVAGVFHQQIDYTSGEILQEGFMRFEEAFITENWSERALKRAERQEEKGKGRDPKLFNYKMRNASTLADGSIIGTMEQNYIQLMSNSNISTGQMNDTYYYYYNDIVVYKINLEGDFDWVKRINKYQVSTNDDGPYSSYESYYDSTGIHFIFNDNMDNYNAEGNFIETGGIYTTSFGRRGNVAAIATIDYKTGKITRTTLFERSEIEVIAMPKLFNVDYKNKELLLYSTWGRSERFGVLKLK